MKDGALVWEDDKRMKSYFEAIYSFSVEITLIDWHACIGIVSEVDGGDGG